MLLSIEGEEKTGKTTLAYTAPLPIVGFSFDLGSNRAINGIKYGDYFKELKIQIVKNGDEVEPGNDITIYELPQPIQLVSDRILGCIELWDKFIGLLGAALTSSPARTVVIDTMTLTRRLKCEAYLQELQVKGVRKQLTQIEYGHPNDAIRNIYNVFQSVGKNLVAVHHETDEYKDIINSAGNKESVTTGNKVLEGYNRTYQAVDIAVRTKKDKGQISAGIKVCGYDPGLEGTSITNPTWDKLVNLIDIGLEGRIKLDRRQEV